MCVEFDYFQLGKLGRYMSCQKQNKKLARYMYTWIFLDTIRNTFCLVLFVTIHVSLLRQKIKNVNLGYQAKLWGSVKHVFFWPLHYHCVLSCDSFWSNTLKIERIYHNVLVFHSINTMSYFLKKFGAHGHTSRSDTAMFTNAECSSWRCWQCCHWPSFFFQLIFMYNFAFFKKVLINNIIN
jgi:hypothetical protein